MNHRATLVARSGRAKISVRIVLIAIAPAATFAMSSCEKAEAPSRSSSDRFAKLQIQDPQLSSPAAPSEALRDDDPKGSGNESVEFDRDGEERGSRATLRKKQRAPEDEAQPVLSGVAKPEPEVETGEGGEGERRRWAPTRAWFPETLLFSPMTRTNEAGEASISVRVPDRLTTWRVLALAHAKDGSLGGAVTKFVGTLPTYVEPNLPPFLVAGDEIEIPVQVVNTTDSAKRGALAVEVSGPVDLRVARTLTIPDRGSALEIVRLRVDRPGEMTFDVTLDGQDRVVRTVPVRSAYPAWVERRSGTLAAARSFETELPTDIERESATMRISVFPGALSILRAEIQSSPDRAGMAEDAYALRLAGQASELLTALGEEADASSLRNLRIRAGQRVVRHARSPGSNALPLLLSAVSPHRRDPFFGRLADRLEGQLARTQGPDGFFRGETGWTVQRLLVHTAEALRALDSTGSSSKKSHLEGVRVRAAGAFERNGSLVNDGYTASALLASGLELGGLEERLAKLIEADLAKQDDGSIVLTVKPGTERGDGEQPSTVEATALAILALAPRPSGKAVAFDLGAALLASYGQRRGFGDGRANSIAIEALSAVFRDPLPPSIEITVSLDGNSIASTTLSGARRKDVSTIVANTPNAGGRHTWSLEARPAVAGLGFDFALEHHRPPLPSQGPGESAFAIAPTGPLVVGEEQAVVVQAEAPRSARLELECLLPAGVAPVRTSLESLVSSGAVHRFEIRQDGVVLESLRREGADLRVAFRVVPNFSGTLRPAASKLTINGSDVRFSTPSPWKIQPRR